MQTIEEKVDTSKALDVSLVDIESSGTESKEQDKSSKSGNDAHADDAEIRPIYDEEPMAEEQTTAEINVFATGQQHTEQPKFNNEGDVDHNAKQCHDKCPLPAKLTDNQITELSTQSLESENIWDFENYLSPEYGSQDIISLSPSESAEVKEDFSMTLCDLDKRMSIGLEEFIDIDDMWDDLDPGILTNEISKLNF
ncbi:hypothetical protein Tco_0051393 [Tanacetum coccineum]